MPSIIQSQLAGNITQMIHGNMMFIKTPHGIGRLVCHDPARNMFLVEMEWTYIVFYDPSECNYYPDEIYRTGNSPASSMIISTVL